MVCPTKKDRERDTHRNTCTYYKHTQTHTHTDYRDIEEDEFMKNFSEYLFREQDIHMILIHLLFLHSRPPKRRQLSQVWLPAFYLSLDHLKLQTSCLPGAMEKVQYLTRSAIRRASTIEMPQQARQNFQNLFINFCLILICLLLICIIVMLL